MLYTTGGGGWTVILKRQDNNIDFFNNDWIKYEDGFGNVFGEYWLGLRSIHCLTSTGNWELRIDYELANGTAPTFTTSSFQWDHLTPNID